MLQIFGDEYLDFCLLKEEHPEIADRIYKEYERLNGAIPYAPGFVYVIQAVGTNYYKLGKTSNPDRRLLQIAPQMPFSTRFVKVWRTNFMSVAESWLHNHFAKNRTNGEWFEFEVSESRQLFHEFEDEYAEQIRHAYGAYFFELVVKDSEFFKAAKSRLSDKSDHVAYMGFWGGSPISIAWIESVFQTIESERNPLPSDVRTVYNSLVRSETLLREKGEA